MNKKEKGGQKMKRKLFSTLASLALVMTFFSTCGYCFWAAYQEEVPAEAKRLIKGKK